MPRISFFYGILITMNIGDHVPVHIHAWYQGEKASFDFDGENAQRFDATKAKTPPTSMD